MIKEKRYRYVGINGILDSAICLEDVPCTIYTRLQADVGNILTDGVKERIRVDIYDGDDESVWTEVPIEEEA